MRNIPRVAPDSQGRTLTDSHKDSLLIESSIALEIVSERGYFTARTTAEHPKVIKPYQRRAGDLVIPTLSPGGVRGYRVRHRKPRTRPDGKAAKYEQGGGVG